MKVKVKIFGIEELIDKMGGKEETEVDFPGGNVNKLFTALLDKSGFRWEDFPLLENWEENLRITIIHNEEVLLKEHYAQKDLRDGDRLSFLLYTGCC